MPRQSDAGDGSGTSNNGTNGSGGAASNSDSAGYSGGGSGNNYGRGYATEAPATVADTSIALVSPLSAEAQASYAARNAAESIAVASSAPNGGGGGSVAQRLFTLDNASTVLSTGFSLSALIAGGPPAWAAALGLAKTYNSGAYGKIGAAFGSPAPSTNVTAAPGATQAANNWFSGGSGSGRGSVVSGSPVIGWQGAPVNQAPAAKASTAAQTPPDYLGFSALRPTTQPAATASQGASGGATSNTTGLVGLALGLGLLAAMG